METAERDPQIEWEENERRVRGVLLRLVRLETGSLSRGAREVYCVSPWEWKTDVQMALNRLSGDRAEGLTSQRMAWRGRPRTVGEIVLLLRLLGGYEWLPIAAMIDTSDVEAKAIYGFSLRKFIEELNALNRDGIPDDYTERIAA